jgi:hypothetical protein
MPGAGRRLDELIQRSHTELEDPSVLDLLWPVRAGWPLVALPMAWP